MRWAICRWRERKESKKAKGGEKVFLFLLDRPFLSAEENPSKEPEARWVMQRPQTCNERRTRRDSAVYSFFALRSMSRCKTRVGPIFRYFNGVTTLSLHSVPTATHRKEHARPFIFGASSVSYTTLNAPKIKQSNMLFAAVLTFSSSKHRKSLSPSMEERECARVRVG